MDSINLDVHVHPLRDESDDVYQNHLPTPHPTVAKALEDFENNKPLLQAHLDKAYKLEKIIREDIDVNTLVKSLIATFYLH